MAFNDGTCLCVRGVPASCREADLDALFCSHGRVLQVHLPAAPVSTGMGHRGYAFVTLSTPTEAKACIAALNGVEFNGCRLSVAVSKRSAPHTRTPGVYIGLRRDGCGASPGARGRSRGGSCGRSAAAVPPSSCVKRSEVSLPAPRIQPDADPPTLAEPLSEPQSATAAGPLPPVNHRDRDRDGGRGEPLLEPVTEPGGEPLVEEECACGAEERPRAGGVVVNRALITSPTRAVRYAAKTMAEPGGEPLIEEESACCADVGEEKPKSSLRNMNGGGPMGLSCGAVRHRRNGSCGGGAGPPRPVAEPGGEPLIEEDPVCGMRRNSSVGFVRRSESPRSRITQLEEANIRVVAKQTVDSLLLQFQQHGFSDARAAVGDCLEVSLGLLGARALSARPATAVEPSPAPHVPPVLVGPDEFKNPSSFLRIYGDPLAATAPRKGGGRPESHQDGNWRCEACGNVNFPRRQRCHKCHAIRGPGGDAIVMQYCVRVYEALVKGKACS